MLHCDFLRSLFALVVGLLASLPKSDDTATSTDTEENKEPSRPLVSQEQLQKKLGLCYKLVKTRSQYYSSIQSYGILKSAKTSNLKAHNNEKMDVKEKEPYFNFI